MSTTLRLRTIVACAAAIVVPSSVAGQPPLRIDTLAVSEPVTLTQVDMGRLKGEPSRLAWSPDGTVLYLQTLEGGFGLPNVKLRHYQFAIAAPARKDLQIEPEWASAYWTLKSGQTSPEEDPLKIELKSEKQRMQTTAVPRGGDLARGGTTVEVGAATPDGVMAAFNAQTVAVHTMLLQGQTVGEFTNSAIVPGLTFGWAPNGMRAIAFAALKTGRIVVMDDHGTTIEVAGSKDALLPAWSPDGARLAWLQKDGRKTFVIRIVSVSPTKVGHYE